MSAAGARGPVLALRGATIGYAGTAVVRRTDLQVMPGEVVALLGANGSGKSTLVRGVLGLAQVLSGQVEIFGVPRHRFSDHARIGYVPQRHTVAGTVPATVREVVATGRLARLGLFGRPGRRDREAIERAIETVDLADRADSSLAELSGGQQRRVLIARALASEPDVLIMDEPTAGVDTSHQRGLAATLRSLAADDVTMVVVTHEVGPLVPIVTRAVVMHEGRPRYDGPLLPSMVGASDGLLELVEHTHHAGDDEDPSDRPGWVAEPTWGT